jgi:hypothetical protein
MRDTDLLNNPLFVTVLFEEDGKSSRHDHSRELWVGATEPVVMDVLAGLFSPPTGESCQSYPIREAKRGYSHLRPYHAELMTKKEISRSKGVARKVGVLYDLNMISCKRLTTVRRCTWL